MDCRWFLRRSGRGGGFCVAFVSVCGGVLVGSLFWRWNGKSGRVGGRVMVV